MIKFRAKARLLSKYKFKNDFILCNNILAFCGFGIIGTHQEVKYFEKNYLNWLVIENSGGLCKMVSGQ